MQNQNDLQQFDKLKADVTLFVDPVFKMTVANQEESKLITDTGREVKSWLKKVEEKRKDLVKPLRDRAKEIDSYASQITEPLARAEAHIKKQLAAFADLLDKQRAEEMKRAEEERKKQEAEMQAKLKAQAQEAELEALFKSEPDQQRDQIVRQVEAERSQKEIENTHKANVKSINSMRVSGARKIWKGRVVSIQDVPWEYLEVNMTKIMKDFNAGKFTDLPGIVFEQETSIAIR